jgi:hypothetical protein
MAALTGRRLLAAPVVARVRRAAVVVIAVAVAGAFRRVHTGVVGALIGGTGIVVVTVAIIATFPDRVVLAAPVVADIVCARVVVIAVAVSRTRRMHTAPVLAGVRRARIVVVTIIC